MAGKDDKYEVGYGKPPRHRQWRKGQSGNPSGRKRTRIRRRSMDLEERLRRAAEKKIPITRNGKSTSEPWSDVFIESIMNDSLSAPVLQRTQLFKFLVELGALEPNSADRWPSDEAREKFLDGLAEADEKRRKSGKG